jgi:RNA ligase
MLERKSLNKIVVDYKGQEKLILLAIRNTDSGEETPGALDSARELGFDVIDEIQISLDELKNEIQRKDFINKEGFVIVYENGFKVKIKYAEYFRLHKIISNVNERFVWEFMSQGKPLELINIPDETFQFIKDTQKSLQDTFDAKWKEFDKIYQEVHLSLNQKYGVDNWEKKDFALIVVPVHKKLSGVLFKLYENRINEAKEIVWKMIEPTYGTGVSGFQSMKKEV